MVRESDLEKVAKGKKNKKMQGTKIRNENNLILRVVKIILTGSRMVIARGSGKRIMENYYLMGIVLQFYKIKRIMEKNGRNDWTLCLYLISLDFTLKNGTDGTFYVFGHKIFEKNVVLLHRGAWNIYQQYLDF